MPWSSVEQGLRALSWPEAFALSLLENGLIVALSAALGHALIARFQDRRITEIPPRMSALEWRTMAFSTLANTMVTLAGFELWRRGVIRFRTDTGLRAWLDVAVLVAGMDFGMYVLHRLAHAPWLFDWLHALHHKFANPRPLTLFVLSPLEALAFGALWLVVIAVYPSSWLGISVYLALNVAFGAIGHLGVEPFPARWVHWPVLRHLGTSTFHAQHHHAKTANFGFYTLIWDRLFGTLHPTYDAHFGRPHRKNRVRCIGYFKLLSDCPRDSEKGL